MKSRFQIFCLSLIVSSIFAFTDPNVVHALSGRAYITNWNSNTVSVIDTSSNTVIATIPVGGTPFGVVVNDIIRRVYVSNSYDNTISVIDTDSHDVIATIPIDNIATGLTINPVGTRVYAAYNRINGASLAVIDTSNNTIIKKIDAGWTPFGIDINSNGTRVYVTSRYEEPCCSIGAVKAIDTSNDTVIDSIYAGFDPLGIVVNKSGTRVYVVRDGDALYTIDATINSIINSLPIGIQPLGITINSSGSLVYVVNRRKDFVTCCNGSIAIVYTNSNRILDLIEVGSDAVGIALLPDDSKAYIANGGNDNVSVLETTTNSIINTIPVGDGPVAFGRFIDTRSPMKVEIDIIPGSFPNSINPKSNAPIPVAILTTDTFDATTVDPNAVRFGATGTEATPMRFSLEDVNRDGRSDLLLQFRTKGTNIACRDTSASLTGETSSGQEIEGTDAITTVGCN